MIFKYIDFLGAKKFLDAEDFLNAEKQSNKEAERRGFLGVGGF